jgi:hypothetical protein
MRLVIKGPVKDEVCYSRVSQETRSAVDAYAEHVEKREEQETGTQSVAFFPEVQTDSFVWGTISATKIAFSWYQGVKRNPKNA